MTFSIFRSGLVTNHLNIAHKPGSRGAAANIVVRWSFPTKLKFSSAQVINGPQYTGLADQESALIVKVKLHFYATFFTFLQLWTPAGVKLEFQPNVEIQYM